MSVRIERLSIRDFGPLRDLVLVPGEVTVVHGQNEAGKTSCIDALTHALRERVRPGNRKMLENLRDGPGFQGEIDLLLAPEDGGPVVDLLSDHPSLTRLFIVRDADASLEGGRGWLNAIRGRLIGIDLARVSERVRSAASLGPNGTPREARQDERQRLAERLSRLEGFLADLPAISRLLEESHQLTRGRGAARNRVEKLRAAERFERFRLAQRAVDTVENSRKGLQELERYGEDDLTAWREAVVAVREAAVVAKSGEHEAHRLRDEQTLSAEEVRKREIAADKARTQTADCTRRDLDGLVERARNERSSARLWTLWRTPLAIAGVLLLLFSVGVGVEATARDANADGVPLGLLAGASAVLGLLGAGLSIFGTSRNRSAKTLEDQAVAACGAVLAKAGNLDECTTQLGSISGNAERAEAERGAAVDQKRIADKAVRTAERTEAERHRRLEETQRMVADVRERVRLASIDQLEEKLKQRTQIASTLEEALRTVSGLLGDGNADLPLERRMEALTVPDPEVAPDAHELAALERELEGFDERLLALKGEIGDRRDRALSAISLPDLGAAEAERERLAQGIEQIDAEVRGGQLGLQALRELAQDIDRPLREALGNGPGAAGSYLARLTGGRYVAVVLDENGGLAVERDDGTRFGTDALSRGAKDQLALAVRVALVRRLLGEPGFLALDDAFLTSDASRREALATAFSELAEEGWQILYFTFDAGLRDRLASRGAKVIELPTPSRSTA
ncbi:MAG: AAA family ATPase [Candidatus Binatia bacterium]|nr:AAA family ATPase [Candidatus Binatia bacterium]